MKEISVLKSRSASIRKNIVRLSYVAQSAHVGSSLSCVEILNTVFALRESDSDFASGKMILSKGHAAMALYGTAHEYGLLPESNMAEYLKDGTSLWGHPSKSDKFDFIHWSTGSLGHGLPVTTGFAYSTQKLRGSQARHVCVLSDGELDEGSNWEAILFAGHHQLSNLVAIIDYNKIQSFGRCKDVLDLDPLKSKFEAFRWRVAEVDGHNESEIAQALNASKLGKGPSVVIAHTIKAKGLVEVEDTVESHYKPINKDQFERYGQ